MNVLLIGSGAREHAMARAISRSRHHPTLFCYGTNRNPGILSLAAALTVGSITDVAAIAAFAKQHSIDWVIVGPEAPLEVGVVDALMAIGVPSVGPTKKLAQIETSKSFTRNLLTARGIMGCPRYRYFSTMEGVATFLAELKDLYVVKADGLMGGKGVKVAGDHLYSHQEALAWCEEILTKSMGFVIEEKLLGQEFSLMSFSDGEHLAHLPAVQDHKRAFAGDTGPNTGGMGSYSNADHSLPFLAPHDIEQAQTINEASILALQKETGEMYKGILYGGFMATAAGVKLIEYNARFGDPETINVLPLLTADFVEVCLAIIQGTLHTIPIGFARQATVCKYVVPQGYPNQPIKNAILDVSRVHDPDCLYYAAVNQTESGIQLTGSRAVAVVGMADTIAEAERIAEGELCRIGGPVYHREDIGAEELIAKRVEMMHELRG